jgi:hypothetical protein
MYIVHHKQVYLNAITNTEVNNAWFLEADDDENKNYHN